MKAYEYLGLRQREIEFRFRETGIHYDPFFREYRARAEYPDGYRVARDLRVYLDESYQTELRGIVFFGKGGLPIFVSRFNISLLRAFYDYLILEEVIQEEY